jgi:hypothetical protein
MASHPTLKGYFYTNLVGTLNCKIQRNDTPMLRAFYRCELDLQVGFPVDLQHRHIERPLLEVRPDWQRRFADDIALPVLDRLQAKHTPKLLERNGLGSFLDILFRPTVETQRILAPEPGIGRLLLHVLREPLP